MSFKAKSITRRFHLHRRILPGKKRSFTCWRLSGPFRSRDLILFTPDCENGLVNVASASLFQILWNSFAFLSCGLVFDFQLMIVLGSFFSLNTYLSGLGSELGAFLGGKNLSSDAAAFVPLSISCLVN
ncbi:hypothetical protein QYF36_005516 [Acer negundo]|nr:hypothetical protein QYF36_005516 [Acer negundo]